MRLLIRFSFETSNGDIHLIASCGVRRSYHADIAIVKGLTSSSIYRLIKA